MSLSEYCLYKAEIVKNSLGYIGPAHIEVEQLYYSWSPASHCLDDQHLGYLLVCPEGVEDDLSRLLKRPSWLAAGQCLILYSRMEFFYIPLRATSTMVLSQWGKGHTAFCFQVPVFGVVYEIANADLEPSD